MGLYDRYCLPHMLNLACNLEAFQQQRKKVVPLATGRVLEVGMGSGLNIPYYNTENVEFVWGLEPSIGMKKKAKPNLQKAGVPVHWLGAPGEEIPLEDKSADTILLTYTLCTIPGWQNALAEMRRVLKPNGKLVFCEHGESPDEDIRKWQERVNPFWKRIAGGCNLNRPIPSCIEGSGFEIEKLDSQYIDGPKIAAYNYWGIAKRA